MKRIKGLLLLGVMLIFLCTKEIKAFEVESHKMKGGINGRKYYLDSTVNTAYWKGVFQEGIRRWNQTNTLFYFTETKTKSKGVIIGGLYANSVDGAYGYTRYVYGSSSNWEKAEIYLNTFYLQSTSYDKDIGVAAHEIGHSIGLKHVRGNFLMTPSSWGRTVTSPQSDDVNGVNYIYKTK